MLRVYANIKLQSTQICFVFVLCLYRK